MFRLKGVFHQDFSPTLYLFLQPGTGQAKGFSSPPFIHMELRMDSELMALSVVHDSSLSDSSKSTSSSSHSLPAGGSKTKKKTRGHQYPDTGPREARMCSLIVTHLWPLSLQAEKLGPFSACFWATFPQPLIHVLQCPRFHQD